MRACVLALVICLAGGCASHRPADAGGLLVRRSQASYADEATFDAPGAARETSVRPQAKLPDGVSTAPVAKNTSDVPTVESQDALLKATIAALNSKPSASAYLAVGAEYHRLGVLDRAESSFQHALQIDGHSSAASDGIARVWRDWGFPEYGLPYAYRAIGFAPRSAAPENTLGTLLFALGDLESARAHFEKAVSLDPMAGWAQSNLCYAAFMLGEGDRAMTHCAQALALAPTLLAAHNNLGLLYAAQGQLEQAAAEFAKGAERLDGADAHYNMGIARLARREFRDAIAPFEFACHATPAVAGACAWATQARKLAAYEPLPADGHRTRR